MVDPHDTVDRGAAGRHPAVRRTLRLLRWVVIAAVLIPVLLLATCVGRELLSSRELADLCATLAPGRVLEPDARPGIESRSARVPERAEDWFDREYRRILAAESLSEPGGGDLTVLFAKPGLGYYACIVRHRDGRIVTARFVDRSS